MRFSLVLALALMACGGSARPPAGAGFAPSLPLRGARMPDFRASRWLGSRPLSREALAGRVVLVDFWEYTCVNCIRTLPYVQAWHERYRDAGLVVIGVHAPEFEFAKESHNVERGVREHGLTYPIALDNEFATWNAYDNHAWPAKYLFGADGRLVSAWVGEGRYPEVEAAIRAALVASGARELPRPTEITAAYREERVRTGRITEERYLGTLRRVPETFALEGTWSHSDEYLEHEGSKVGRLRMTFRASEVNLVADPGGRAAEIVVRLDGRRLDEAHGTDVGRDGVARFDRPGMVSLVRGAALEEHELVLETRSPGLRLFAFTFGP